MARTVLVIDDEQNMRWVLRQALEKAGYEVLTAENGPKGLQQFSLNRIDLVLLDLKMPGADGLSVLRDLRQRSADVPILLLTAYATVPTAVEALQLGASDYLRKPFDLETVLGQISRYIARQTQPEADVEVEASGAVFGEFVGASTALIRPLALAEAAAFTQYPVVICGEPGSGRRHLARLIHRKPLATAPGRLAVVDCASLPRSVLEKELLDESDDAGARRWQQALGGTLLLANAGAIDEPLRADLVCHLCAYQRTDQRPHGLRLIITTEGRLPGEWAPITDEAIVIDLPPLRARLEDLPLLRRHFAPEAEWSQDATAYLAAYPWPGNVAEFRRVVEQAALLAGQVRVRADHLPGQLTAATVESPAVFALPPEGIDLDDVEKDLIRQALAMAQGNKSRAARLLGLSRATLLYRLDKYGIDTAIEPGDRSG